MQDRFPSLECTGLLLGRSRGRFHTDLKRKNIFILNLWVQTHQSQQHAAFLPSLCTKWRLYCSSELIIPSKHWLTLQSRRVLEPDTLRHNAHNAHNGLNVFVLFCFKAPSRSLQQASCSMTRTSGEVFCSDTTRCHLRKQSRMTSLLQMFVQSQYKLSAVYCSHVNINHPVATAESAVKLSSRLFPGAIAFISRVPVNDEASWPVSSQTPNH